ncbi:MAG: aminomethyl-transferring glycine dehydrogenase subunit GcvPA [Candidatus Margulisbacteria bacterium]|jgi:glycine dehydrogenase subunit 1|nr:aminomethyl-transferring glycine dehydrogenase subunit GcvPA [Candidatus Margulisiibacteriota bacterium]
MAYFPHTETEVRQMLETIGVQSLEELFADVPEKYRKEKIEDFPALNEMELMAEVNEQRFQQNHFKYDHCFTGAGRYDHFIPAVVPQLAGRSEFYTAYTPYQPEISQGTLTAIYEFQSMICELTGMDVANASLYDGATALAEAVSMAVTATGRKEYVIANPLHPNYAQVLKTYLTPRNITAGEKIGQSTAAVIFVLPDYHGLISDWSQVLAEAKAAGALLIVCADPLLLSVIEPPQADIIVGEAQPLGLPMSYGGPALGFLAARQNYLRQMPGRIIGRTTDDRGNRPFVLTMQTREQHIRREKATSNICSNEALCALTATIYMSYMGASGLQTVARLCKANTDYAMQKLGSIPGFSVEPGEHFRDFVLHCPTDAREFRINYLHEDGIEAISLSDKDLLLSVTEKTLRESTENSSIDWIYGCLEREWKN